MSLIERPDQTPLETPEEPVGSSFLDQSKPNSWVFVSYVPEDLPATVRKIVELGLKYGSENVRVELEQSETARVYYPKER